MYSLLGSIAGDVIGSVFEWDRIKNTEFDLFDAESQLTDDTVITIAVADSILNDKDYISTFKYWGRKYPNSGYGGYFRNWLFSENSEPYNSFGNGSAMRVSPVGFAFNSIEEVMENAMKSAEVTHNHPEGIKGAQATAVAIFLARIGKSKNEIKEYIESSFGYNLSRSLEKIRPEYEFDETCQKTVPESIISFLESDDYESSIRNAVSLGGDSDTLACITGGIAYAYYKTIPDFIVENVISRLPDDMMEIIKNFDKKYKI